MSALDPPRALPAVRGAALGLLAAVLFGASTPLVQRFGVGIGGFSTAALLYLGAALCGAVLRRPAQREARVRLTDAPRLLLMAAFGAGVGPVALAWGLQHTSATSASLMLSLEAVFTAILARVAFHETMDGRVKLALGFLTLGGMVLLCEQMQSSTADLIGLVVVAFATLAWALDNTLSRPLAERDPGQVVMLKATMGAVATGAVAALLQEPPITIANALPLVVIGAAGYGLSLQFYLRAQRTFGAARTASIFAFAPFIGAFVAVCMGERTVAGWTVAGALLMLAGVVLHLMERHSHLHWHDPIDHEHSHRHDDGHHFHLHTPMPVGAHSHGHRHTPLSHSHAHVPDIHHTHTHEA